MDWNRLPLARADVDRAAHLRDDDRLRTAWASAGTAVVLVVDGAVATVGGTRLDLVPVGELGVAADDDLLLFLGARADDVAYLALVGSAESLTARLGRPLELSHLREVGHALDDRDAGLAATAVGLAAWHERHPRCARCGAATVPAQAGWTRRCVDDGSEHYPRTDPAIIVAVRDADDRLLLAHAAHWPRLRRSVLAGYVEPGESAEAAVHREVREEVALGLSEVTYRGSQAWPFPASLMLAYVATATGTQVVVDGVELTEADWFTRERLADDVAAGRVQLPMRASVARVLIEEWFGGPVPATGD